MQQYRSVIILSTLLILASLACSLPARQAEPTPTLVPAATVDPTILEDQLATAQAEFAQSGKISLTITEQQLTSYVAQRLSEQPDTPFTNPQITLSDGQMALSGQVKIGFITGQARIIFAPEVQDGRLQVTIISANIGSIPFPDSALNQITDSVNQNLNDFITVEGRSVRIETFEIANGVITISGSAQ
jgi:uncharacterized protein YpmS